MKRMTAEACSTLTSDIVAVLAQYGFPHVRPRFDDRIHQEVVTELDTWYDIAVSPSAYDQLPEGPRPLLLDQITIACAQCFVAQGIPLVSETYATLNGIRSMLRKIFGHLGYRFWWEFGGHTLWGCYPEWQALARAEGSSEARAKEEAQKHHEEWRCGRGSCFLDSGLEEQVLARRY